MQTLENGPNYSPQVTSIPQTDQANYTNNITYQETNPNYENIQTETLDQNNNNIDNNNIINNNSINTDAVNTINEIKNEDNKIIDESNKDNSDIKKISPYEVISFLSWILFISSKWNSYNQSIKCNPLKMSGKYRPILFDSKFYDLISLLICISGFLNYIVQVIYKKNNNLKEGLFGKVSKFHFVPLIFYTILNVIKEAAIVTINKPDMDDNELRNAIAICSNYHLSDAFDPKALFTLYLILNIFTLVLFIILYIKTDMNCEWYIVMTIKKGIYSILIVEIWYQIFDSIYSLRLIDVSDDEEAKINFMKSAGIFFALIIGGGCLLFSFFFKNITVLFFNLLMYLGMIIGFYGVNKQDEKVKENLNGDTEGILQILILITDFLFIIVMIIKYKDQLVGP